MQHPREPQNERKHREDSNVWERTDATLKLISPQRTDPRSEIRRRHTGASAHARA